LVVPGKHFDTRELPEKLDPIKGWTRSVLILNTIFKFSSLKTFQLPLLSKKNLPVLPKKLKV